MNNHPEEVYKSRQVIELLTVANEYCLFVEKAPEYGKEKLLDFVSKICPLLYLKGALLPPVIAEDTGANERFVTQEQWQSLFLALNETLGDDDIFWYAVPESDGQVVLMKASLAEHLADIYQDMKDFVLLYQKNLRASKENAASEIRLLFSSHWGIRISQLQRHVHRLIHGEPDEGSEELNELLSGI
ncbi:MAG: DUF5063 domain-containing protein [Bacteroidales bacterium]|nr:DUF5063 domain-containing protein [Lentimicrobiaceae bacterium]MDD5694688.1 DUF5063 domain-containing protein [Bacteroidales bacterium]